MNRTPFRLSAPVLPTLVLSAGLILLSSCSPAPPPPPASPASPPSVEQLRDAALERGSEIVAQAGRALSGALQEGIRAGGVTNALPICSVQAIPLTATLARANQVELRRVSHRARNPLNRANPQEMEIVQQFEAALAQGEQPVPEVVSLSPDEVTFFAPIVLRTNLCLNCHGVPGEGLSPEVEPLLQSIYPEDEATGFRVGDLRGLWRIDFPVRALAAWKPDAEPDTTN